MGKLIATTQATVHVLGDRGTVRLELDEVERFDSGVVLLTATTPSSRARSSGAHELVYAALSA